MGVYEALMRDGKEKRERLDAARPAVPVAPAKQQPLTDSQIWELALVTSSAQGGWESGWNVAFARAIERAHGIEGKP